MQQDIAATLQKIAALNAGGQLHQIEIDLMLEHTRSLYTQIQALQQAQPHTTPISVVQTEVIETTLPEPEIIEETPAIEIKPAELIQQLHTSVIPEPTLEDLIPEILEQAPEVHTPIPPVANVPQEFIDQILPEPNNIATAAQAATMVAPPEQMVVAQQHNEELDIRKLIGINDKYQYISELFANDKETYEIVLARLNKFESYADAVTWMDEVHTENRWDDEHPTVISFYDIMSQFFASR